LVFTDETEPVGLAMARSSGRFGAAEGLLDQG
jgi:hypothetical protein